MDLRVGFCSIIILKTLEALGSMTSCNNHENFLLSICEIGAHRLINQLKHCGYFLFIIFFSIELQINSSIYLFINVAVLLYFTFYFH